MDLKSNTGFKNIDLKNLDIDFTQAANALKDALKKQKSEEKFSFAKIKILQPSLKEHSALIAFSILFTILTSLILLPAPLIQQVIIDDCIANKDVAKTIRLGTVLLCVYVIYLITKVALNYIFSKLNNKLLLSVKRSLFEKIISLPLSFFSKQQSSYLQSRINEIDNVGTIFSVTFISLAVSLLGFIFSAIILLILSWKIFLIAAVFIPLQYCIVTRFSGGIKSVSNTMLEKTALLNKNIQEIFAGIDTVKSFSTEDKEKQKVDQSISSVFKSSFLQSFIVGFSTDIAGFINNLSFLVVLVASVFLIIHENFSIGLYIACVQYLNRMFMPVQAFTTAGVIMQPAIVAIDRINEYFQMIGEDTSTNGKYRPKRIKGKIEFRKVSFSYEDNNELLKDVSFIIDPGDKAALWGANGAGKTTILKLMLGLHLPLQGAVFVDDENLTTFNLTGLRKRLGLVSQDVFLFNDTILNNLIYGCSAYSSRELKQIVDRFCSFIYDLPGGLDTMVGETGRNLSGGQKQAVSIVRTLLKHPDVFVFDEGASHLDNSAYSQLKMLIDEYFADKTCIFISHNADILNQVNRVFIIENNSIHEKPGKNKYEEI